MPVSISGDGAITGLEFNSFGDVDIVSPQAGDKLVYDGTNWQNLVGYQYVGTRYYTSSGTFAKADPFGDESFDGAKLRALVVNVVGAGAGGAGAATTGAGQAAPGSGGSGGNYARTLITDIAGLSASVSVTVGAGAAGGIGNANGNAGADSSFGTVAVGKGGLGGETFGPLTVFQTVVGRNPQPTGNVGDYIEFGGSSNGTPLINAGRLMGGGGGSSKGGAGGLDANTATGTNGQSPPNARFGAGGGAAANTQNQATARDGGAGANGFVWVDVFA